MSTSKYQFALGTMPVEDRNPQAIEIIDAASGKILVKMLYDQAAEILLGRNDGLRRLNDRIIECSDGTSDEEQEYVKGLRDARNIVEGHL